MAYKKHGREYWEEVLEHHQEGLAGAADKHVMPKTETEIVDLMATAIVRAKCENDAEIEAAAILHGNACMHALNELNMDWDDDEDDDGPDSKKP